MAEIAAAAGRPIQYRQISPEKFSADMRRAGVPEEVTALLIELFAVVIDGRNSRVMDGVDRIAASWAQNRALPQIVFRPDWARHAKAAPFKRNDAMLDILPIG